MSLSLSPSLLITRSSALSLFSVTIGAKNATVKAIDQRVQFVGSKEGKIIALREIVRKGVTPPVLVFTEVRLVFSSLCFLCYGFNFVIWFFWLEGS